MPEELRVFRMTAPTPEKIERWVPSEGMDSLSLFPDLSGPGETEYVIYTDHLRHLKLAQIEVLEELIAHMRSRYTSEANPTGSYCNEESLWIAEKIEEIRREIG